MMRALDYDNLFSRESLRLVLGPICLICLSFLAVQSASGQEGPCPTLPATSRIRSPHQALPPLKWRRTLLPTTSGCSRWPPETTSPP